MNTINTNLSVKIGNPKISIGIPIYNGEKFLTSTIESILKQEGEEMSRSNKIKLETELQQLKQGENNE